MEPKLEELINILDKISNNKELTTNEENLLEEIKKETQKDKDLEELFIKLQKDSSKTEKLKEIKNFIQMKEKKKLEQKLNEDKLKAIALVYGINISEIKHHILSDNTEIFMFYHKDLAHNIILENVNKENLSEKLKQKQKEKTSFQGKESKNNAYNMMKDERQNTDAELDLIPINLISSYQYIIDGLTDEKKKSLNNLLKNKDKYHIEYINIEHVFGISTLDYGNKIYESYLDKQELIIKEPKTLEYSQKEITRDNNTNNEVNINSNIDYNYLNIDITINEEDYEDIPTLLEDEIKEISNKEELKKEMKYYINNQDKLKELPEEKRTTLVSLIKIFISKIKTKRKSKQNTRKHIN